MKDNQLKRGALLSYLTIIINIAVGILFTPFMLRCLGQAQYGLYQLIGAFVGYIAILDFGLGNAIIRYVAKYRAEHDRTGEENFLGTCLSIYLIISLFVLLVGVICYLNIQSIFAKSLSPIEMEQARIMFGILVFNLAISLPLNSFDAIMSGYERFVYLKTLGLIRLFLRTGLLVVLLFMGYKAVAIVILDTVLNLLFMAIKMFYVFGKLKVRVKLNNFQVDLLKEIFSYSAFVFLGMAVDVIYWRLGQLVLGIVASTTAVAVFAIGIQLANYYMTFSTAIAGIFLPKATQMVVNNASGEELTDLLIKTGRIQFIMIGYILTAFILFGKTFVMLWAGPEYGVSWLVALLVMVPLTIPLFQNIGISILQAKKMHAFRSIMYICIAIVNAVLSVILARKMGAIGAALGTALSLLIGNVIVINFYYHYRVGLNIPRFFGAIFKRLIPSMIIAAGIGALSLFIVGNSWLTLILRGGIYTCAYLCVMWFLGINHYEKSLICKPFSGIRQNI